MLELPGVLFMMMGVCCRPVGVFILTDRVGVEGALLGVLGETPFVIMDCS